MCFEICKPRTQLKYNGWKDEKNILEIYNPQWQQVRGQVKDATQWGVIKLSLGFQSRTTMMKEIAHVRFTALTFLLLSGNNIQSIEELPCLDMVHLRQLWLDYNMITSVGVIKKAALPSLQILTLSKNYFGDAWQLTEGFLPEIKTFCVYSPIGEEENLFTEQQFLGKIQAVSLSYLWIKQHCFCFYRSIKPVLQQRYTNATI